MAEKLSAAVGRQIRYVEIPDAEFKKAIIGAGLPEWHAERLASLYQYIREGMFPRSSTAFKDVTGREPISFDQFVHDYSDAWRKN